MMKRKSGSHSSELKMPVLYREDLQKIEEIIKVEMAPDSLIIETDEHEFETIKEIPENSESTSLRIHAFRPSLILNFGKDEARIFAPEDSVLVLGTIEKIRSATTKRERRLRYWIQKHVILSLVLSLFAFFLTEMSDSFGIKILREVLAFTAIIWWLGGGYFRYFTFCKIRFYKIEEKSFLERNKDQILLMLISAALGALLGSASTFLITWYFSK